MSREPEKSDQLTEQNGDMTLDIKSKHAEMQTEWKRLHIPATDGTVQTELRAD